MRDIEAIIEGLSAQDPTISVQQLEVLHPGADDDGLWFFRQPRNCTEVQLESFDGMCPFLFESDAHSNRQRATSVSAAVSLVLDGLGAAPGHATPAGPAQ